MGYYFQNDINSSLVAVPSPQHQLRPAARWWPDTARLQSCLHLHDYHPHPEAPHPAAGQVSCEL